MGASEKSSHHWNEPHIQIFSNPEIKNKTWKFSTLLSVSCFFKNLVAFDDAC